MYEFEVCRFWFFSGDQPNFIGNHTCRILSSLYLMSDLENTTDIQDDLTISFRTNTSKTDPILPLEGSV